MDMRSASCAQQVLATGDAALRVNSAGNGPVSAEWMIPKVGRVALTNWDESCSLKQSKNQKKTKTKLLVSSPLRPTDVRYVEADWHVCCGLLILLYGKGHPPGTKKKKSSRGCIAFFWLYLSVCVYANIFGGGDFVFAIDGLPTDKRVVDWGKRSLFFRRNYSEQSVRCET